MISVALIGADGAGKTTIAHKLLAEFPRPIKYIYMGVSMEAANVALPTTRLAYAVKCRLRARKGHTLETGPPVHPDGSVRRKKKSALRSALRLTNRLAEEWYRQYVSWRYRRRGYVVIYDRHFQFDYDSVTSPNNGHADRLSDRLHRWLLASVYPKPDLVLFLDAPGEVLFARKGEGNIAYLESRRRAFLEQGRMLANFVRVDATQPVEKVYADVASQILLHCDAKK